jgi:putative addiction module CopG family antidote
MCPDMLGAGRKEMQVDLTPDQREFVRRAIANGRFRREEDAVEEALSLWEERERARIDMLAALDESEADLSAGGYDDHTAEGSPRLAEDLKFEARSLRRREPS